VSDVEHELFKEIALLRALAVRAARAAIEAQDRADGRHDAWLDEVLTDLDRGQEESIKLT
jgi:hypothetical protein